MKSILIKSENRYIELPNLHQVGLDAPWQWLRQGGLDLMANWPVSLGIGAVFALLGALLVDFAWPRPHLMLALCVGFLYLAPFLAIGFYDLSRRREGSGQVRPFQGVRGHGPSIAFYAVFLTFALSVWERLSAILVALFLRGELAASGSFHLGLLFSLEHLDFVVPYGVAAVLYSMAVFALSVVTLPMLMDREVDLVTAMVTSMAVVKANPLVMLLWALLITVLILAGQALWFVGIAVAFPWLGHATWHAYRDLVERP